MTVCTNRIEQMKVIMCHIIVSNLMLIEKEERYLNILSVNKSTIIIKLSGVFVL